MNAPIVEATETDAEPPPSAGSAAALSFASRVALRFLLTRSAFADSVTKIVREGESYRRALFVIEQRVVRVQIQPDTGQPDTGNGPVAAMPEPLAIDPWTAAEDLEQRSRVACVCPVCSGSLKATCSACAGSLRCACFDCEGRGKVPGVRGLKNCPTCRGQGTTKCRTCRGGEIDCSACDASGRVIAWLAIDRRRLSAVRSHPACAARDAHRAVDVTEDFDAGPAYWPNELVHDSGDQPPSFEVAPELMPSLDPRSDRVIAVREQVFRSTAFRLDYKTALSAGTLFLAGRPLALSASSDDGALAKRLLLIAITALVAFFFACSVPLRYARHAWFSHHGHTGTLFILTLLFGAAAVIAVAGLSLTKRAWTPARVTVPAAIAGALALSAAITFGVSRPSRAGAERAFSAHDFARASLEANALIALGIDRSSGEQIEDAIHLEAVRATPTLSDKVELIVKPWHGRVRREEALELLRPSVEASATRMFDAQNERDLENLAATVELLDVEWTKRLRGFLLVLHAIREAKNHYYTSALRDLDSAAGLFVSKATLDHVRSLVSLSLVQRFQERARAGETGTLTERRDALLDALRLTDQFMPVVGKAPEPSADVLRVKLADVRKEIAKAEERSSDDDDEEAPGGTPCRDGSFSLSTGRGACSHHGGIDRGRLSEGGRSGGGRSNGGHKKSEGGKVGGWHSLGHNKRRR